MAKVIWGKLPKEHPLFKGGAQVYTPRPRPVASAPRFFKVSSFDNFHSGDDDEGTDLVGEFLFPGVALWTAKAVVNKSLSYLLTERISRGRPAPTAAELLGDWFDFGDSAIISVPAGEPPIPFRSSEYAREMAAKMGRGGIVE
jgi:hypothetical protein